jgi:hypothetical protein
MISIIIGQNREFRGREPFRNRVANRKVRTLANFDCNHDVNHESLQDSSRPSWDPTFRFPQHRSAVVWYPSRITCPNKKESVAFCRRGSQGRQVGRRLIVRRCVDVFLPIYTPSTCVTHLQASDCAGFQVCGLNAIQVSEISTRSVCNLLQTAYLLPWLRGKRWLT